MSSYVCVMFQHTVTAILHRPQNDLFLQSDYWSAFASTAYLIHSKNHKTFTPNKSKADLQSNSKYQTDNSIHEMSELLLLMIDEYILIYSQPTSFNKIESTQIVDYCWKYLLKKDATIHDQIRTMLSKNKALSKMHKNLVLVLYCQIRALFRKNSAIFQFKKENRCLSVVSEMRPCSGMRLDAMKLCSVGSHDCIVTISNVLCMRLSLRQ
eukprot:991702_1